MSVTYVRIDAPPEVDAIAKEGDNILAVGDTENSRMTVWSVNGVEVVRTVTIAMIYVNGKPVMPK